MAKEARLRLKIYGRVQGVGFRLGVLERAKRLGLVGWVRNTSGGAVEIIAEGDEDSLAQLHKWCQKGPLFAQVKKIEIDWKPCSGKFREFTIYQ